MQIKEDGAKGVERGLIEIFAAIAVTCHNIFSGTPDRSYVKIQHRNAFLHTHR